MNAAAARAGRTSYRGRFAPSPTGPLHFGSLVAALASYLDARSRGGEWLVRIEDTDTPRIAPGAASGILRTLERCGLEWDGPVVYQSRRAEAYHAVVHELRQLGLVYPCGCSRREIADSAAAGIEGPVYSGKCRGGLPAGTRARALRIETRGAYVAFQDALQGGIAQQLDKDIGDFIVYRADGVYAYQLAVVVDDAEQGITDVVRGADLIESTPRQMYLQSLLGLPRLRYLHVPVAVNERGEKLSKQTHARPIDDAGPASAMAEALRFLGQPTAPDLARAAPREMVAEAVRQWDVQRLPRARHCPAAANPPSAR
ncbi:MAG TPA: tRNA glutamyl-Q(34) synthetase GluQRS [Burkholderiales bacterium]|nr:tRNA glutamyl-Q(34) synthetase GluQRS [Burkholderiales bacterium]